MRTPTIRLAYQLLQVESVADRERGQEFNGGALFQERFGLVRERCIIRNKVRVSNVGGVGIAGINVVATVGNKHLGIRPGFRTPADSSSSSSS